MLAVMAKKRNPWGKVLKALRSGSGLSQSEAAALLGVPVATLQNWEQGRAAPPPYARRLIENVIRGHKE